MNKRILLMVISLLSVFILLYIYAYVYDDKQPANPGFAPATPTDSPKKDVEVKTVKAYEKSKLAKKVKNIPKEIINDPNKEIVASTRLSAHEGTTDVIAVYQKSSGDVSISAKENPPPFIQFQFKGKVGLEYYPVHSENLGDTALRTELKVLRVSKFHLQGSSEIDSKGNYRAGGGIYYEW